MSENSEVTAAEVTFNSEQRGKEIFNVDPRLLVQPEGHNVRTEASYDDEDFQDLKANIKENGVLSPISVYRDTIDGQKVFVVRGDGNRRTRAVKELLAEGHEIARVPVLISRKEHVSEENDLLQMLNSNMAKTLSLYEKGIAFDRLIKKGYTREEIAAKTSVKASEISNGIKLANASKMIQNHMASGLISPIVVLAILRETDDKATQERMVLSAIETAAERVKKQAEAAEAEAKAAAEQVAARLAASTTPEGEVKKVNGRGRPKKEVTAVVATTPKKPTVKAKDVVGLSAKTHIEKLQAAAETLASMGVENEGSTLLKALIEVLTTRKSSPMDIVNLISPAAPVVAEVQLVDALKGETPEGAPAESAETTQEQEA